MPSDARRRPTPLREILGTTLPLIQAPMAGVQEAELATAVTAAGALGSLPCALLGLDALRDELARIAARGTAPLNVNFFCHTPAAPDQAKERRWRERLAPYFEELGIDAASISQGQSRRPFTHEAADVIEPFRPSIVSFHFGLPSADLVERVRRWGARILASATTVDEARWLEARGVDAIIAQGAEAGGHRGMFLGADVSTQVGTFALVPQIVRSVHVPVIAAGGIADAAGIHAAVALGASGVQVGTAYLLSPEATTSAVHRSALSGDEARETAITTLFTGRPARGIVNRLMRELGPIAGDLPPFPFAAAALAPLRAAAERLGRGDFSPMWAGQNTTGCVPAPAGRITDALAAGFSQRSL